MSMLSKMAQLKANEIKSYAPSFFATMSDIGKISNFACKLNFKAKEKTLKIMKKYCFFITICATNKSGFAILY